MTLRIVFMGTPEIAVPTLAAIMAAGHAIAAVYTQPPRPAGRGMAEQRSPVHVHAAGAGLDVQTPRNFKDAAAVETFRNHGADVAVVIAYGLILPPAVLAAPRLGCLNLHASALPRWRGAAPIQRAIMAGDRETAVMVMRMEAGLDTGPICFAASLPIGPEETSGELATAIANRGATLMVEALAMLEEGRLVETPQAGDGVTYAAKIDKAEARIDFAQPASAVHNRIRGLSPFPGAFFEIGEGKRRERIKVLRSTLGAAVSSASPGTVIDADLTVACGTGSVRLVELQRAGKRPMPAADLLRGLAMPIGTVLG